VSPQGARHGQGVDAMKPSLADFPKAERLEEVIQILKEILSLNRNKWETIRLMWLETSIDIIKGEVQARKDFEATLRARLKQMERWGFDEAGQKYWQTKILKEVLGEAGAP
jgi:hypothetical protein